MPSVTRFVCAAAAGAAVFTLAACITSGQGGLPPCEWCGAMEAPPADTLDSTLTIAGPDEPGERIILTGTVYQADGETPAPGVLLYAYQTDATGVYRTDGDETGNGLRHGALRGWLITGPDGEYEIRTIRPASYPNSQIEQHIHASLAPERNDAGEWVGEHRVNDFHFADDPFITDREKRESDRLGRFGNILTLTPNADGVLAAERDLRIGHR